MRNIDPIKVDSPSEINWDCTFDVLVAGFGGAGVSASIEAREQGCSVLAIDRFIGGGATAFSGGIYYAGNTEFQREAGYIDSVDDMFNYLSLEVGDVVSRQTLREFCEQSAANMEWLVQHGVPFDSSAYEGKTIYPPDDKFLYYAGNEKVPAYAAQAKPVPRGHRTKGTGFTGKDFFAALKHAALTSGVKFEAHTSLSRLIVDNNNAIIGAELKKLQQPSDIEKHSSLYNRIHPMQPFIYDKAQAAIKEADTLEARAAQKIMVRVNKGVVLSTGAFSYNVGMLQKYLPQVAKNVAALMRLGSMGCDGSGIEIGMSVGGSIDRMQSVFLGRAIAPPDELVRGLMVNAKGERFINEDSYTGLLGNAILKQPDAKAWLIIDNKTFYRTIRQCVPNGDGAFKAYKLPALLNFTFGGTRKARTLKDLAHKCGFSETVLAQTVADYNNACAQRTSDPGGKNPDYMRPLGDGPYRAINSSIGNKYAFPIFFTLGGLKVDEKSGNVMNERNDVIPGLYAAGRTAVGICSENYFSGMSLADCVYSGRRAARNAAARKD